jgi:hypothetical protein
MSLITDPTLLLAGNSDAATTPGAELVINTTAKTLQLVPTAGDLTLSTSGATGQALYSALKILWKNSSTYIKFPFPMVAITPEQFEFIDGWLPADAATRKALRTCGWAERNVAGAVTALYAGVITLGSLGATDQTYYQQVSSTTASVNFSFQGPVNEAIQILSDPNGDGNYVDGFDRRAYCKLFAREQQKTYASSTLTDIGVSAMTYIVYRFPLSNGSDAIKVADTDATIGAGGVYANINITYFGTDQVRSIGGSNYNYRIIIAGDNKTAEQIYAKVQYLLRQNSDIDTGAGTITGKIADSLLRFVGDSLITSQGVYIDNYNTNDTNRITFTDQSNTARNFPFVAAGTLTFNSNLVNDGSAIYRMYFTTLPGASDDFGESGAVLVKRADGTTDIAGTISSSSISFDFNYDANVQGGRTAATNAAVTVVAIGLTTGQYVVATGTITRAVGQNISLTSALERNYSNA